MFKYAFNIWIVGYEKWGNENYQATFVKDPTVPRGIIMFSPHGNRNLTTPVKIVSVGQSPKLVQ